MYNFPKNQMRIRELMELGYRKRELMEAYMAHGQVFARKEDPARKNSPIIFDTDGFAAYLTKKAASTVARRRGVI